jgi:hypothetical protein
MAMTRYGVIDDESIGDGLAEILEQLSEYEAIQFTHIIPRGFAQLFSSIQEARVDGLVIDLRLDLKSPVVDGQRLPRADYRGSSLAQEIRTRSTERGIFSIPLVLWSAESKLRTSIADDSTSYDLFDRVYDKLGMLDNVEMVASELQSLASGYRVITRMKPRGRSGLLNLLGADDELQKYVDPILGDQFQDRIQYPPHQYAQFVINELLEVPGLLIDEELVAARLGIDIDSQDWPKLRDALQHCRYTGIFSSAWRRWWMPLLNDWWTGYAKAAIALRRAPAPDRLRIIRAATRLKRLRCVSPRRRHSDDTYWFVDAISKEPISIADAVRIRKPKTTYSKVLRSFDYPWQDGFFISRDNATSQSYKEYGYTVHPSFAAAD